MSLPLRSLASAAAYALMLGPALFAQDFESTRSAEVQLRKELRHDALIADYGAIAAGESDDAAAATARMASVTLEMQALTRAGALDALRSLSQPERVARISAAEKSAGEELATAGWLFLVGATAEAEAALAKARDLDPSLKKATDEALAAARGERVPDGGYHRYRGRFLPLAVRDRARAIDDALGALHALDLGTPALPFVPSADETNLERFTTLGPTGPESLRAAAAAVREALQPDYETVRGWLASYARSESQRERLLALHAALQPKRAELRKLIGSYDKPQQPQVDARRAELEELFADYEAEVARDRAFYDRVRPDEAYEILERVRRRENALALVDACLVRETSTGLGPHPMDRPADAVAATSDERHLPGREQSGLEDVLWLLLHLRAGQVRDVLERGADLQRLSKQLTPWERWLVDELLSDAVDLYNARAALSLDATEWQFVDILNRYRRVLGLRPFELEERMNAAARKHSQEMVDLGYFGHVSPVARNRTPSDRVHLEGYGGGVGENCLAGHVDGRGAFEGWYHSPGHHRGMVSGGPHLGVGAVNGHSMWTMVMGGTDLGWRALHRDLSPSRHAECHDAALAWARLLQVVDPSPREQGRLDQTRAAVDALFPDVVPAVARLAFAAAKDDRHPFHEAAPGLLGYVVDTDLPVTWRPLQVAAVAAAIDMLHLGAGTTVRERALAIVRPLVEDVFGYRADGSNRERLDATLKIRARWEDVDQWRFRRAGAPPVAAKVPGRGDGPSDKAKLRVLSKPERLRLARQHGGGSDTERAIENALDFLARIQDEDGGWRARAFVLRDPRFDARSAGLGSAEWDIAMTGLSILAFVSSGHTTDQGDYQETVQRGVRWLASRVEDYGKFETVSGHYMYGHAIATQALCEVYAYTADPYVGTVAQLALDYIAFAQHPGGGGWRYNARQAGDTSVVGWVVMALNSGYKAGLDVVGFRDALRFLDSVTMPGYYQVGYTGMPGLTRENIRLTSVGMVARLFLGQPPEHPKIRMPAWRVVEHLPNARSPDFYYWYYATLALFQVGGDHWKTWNRALKSALLELQDTDRGSPYYGSWPPDRAYGGTGGRIYQTALGVLLLTTYYRYDRAPKVKVYPFTGNLQEVSEPYLSRLRETDDPHDRAVVLRKLVDSLGPSLVPILVDAAGDPKEDRELRKLLASTLVTVAAPRHEALILPLLGSDDADVAAQAARALVEIASEGSADAMIAALNHRHPAVRSFAARALGRLGIAKAAAALGERAKVERHNGVRNEIARALRSLAQRDELAKLVDRALPPGTPGRLSAFEGLSLLEAEGMTERITALQEKEPKLFDRCVGRIEEYGGGAIVPILIELLDSESLDIRQRAIKLLQAVTRHGHGFEPNADPRDRKKAIRTWRAWWKDAGAGYSER